MKDIPFSVYDIFGYLAPGFLVLVIIDSVYFRQLVLLKDPGLVTGILLIGAAYIIGHILAVPSAWLLERKVTKKWLKAPSISLFWKTHETFWNKVFGHYLERFPEPIRSNLLKQFSREIIKEDKEPGDMNIFFSKLTGNRIAPQNINLTKSGNLIYYHAYGKVKKDKDMMAVQNRFLQLYGFSRNMSFSFLFCFVLIPILLVLSFIFRSYDYGWYFQVIWTAKCLILSIGMLILSIAMFFCYLKLYRLYYRELFLAYGELPRRKLKDESQDEKGDKEAQGD